MVGIVFIPNRGMREGRMEEGWREIRLWSL